MSDPVTTTRDEDDSDQALVTTSVCLRFRCDKVALVQRGRFWCCPTCGASYGEDAHGLV